MNLRGLAAVAVLWGVVGVYAALWWAVSKVFGDVGFLVMGCTPFAVVISAVVYKFVARS